MQLTDEDYVNFHRQNFMQNGIYKNHFFDYEDMHAKYRTHRSDISTGLAPLRCVCGPRTWHKIDKSTIDPAKRQGLGPRISYKVSVINMNIYLGKYRKYALFHFCILGTSYYYE